MAAELIYISHIKKYPGDERKWYHVASDESLDEIADFVTELVGHHTRLKLSSTNRNQPHMATRGYIRYDIPYVGKYVDLYVKAVEKAGGASNITVVRRAGRVLKYSLSGQGSKALEEMARLPG